jgi:AraC-like DNA-binding protein
MKHESKSNFRYLTLHEGDLNWGLIVTTAGFQSIKPHTSYPPAGHPENYDFNFERGRVLEEFQLVYVTKGNGSFESESRRTVQISEGTVFLLFPGEWHRYRPDPEIGWDTLWVGFKGQFADNLIACGYLSRINPVIEIGFDDEIVGLGERIIEAGKDEKPGYQQFISGMVVHLLGYLYYREKDKHFEHKEAVQKIHKARLLIREQIDFMLEPEQIAEELNMSYSWFRRLFKQYTGLAPMQYISGLRLQRAKELLSGTSKSVKEIAGEMNFENVDYFSLWFRKLTGTAPTQFRNLLYGKEKPKE